MAKGIKTGGRQAGVANKVTRGVQGNLLDVFEIIGGIDKFAEWAKENPTEFYKHYMKLLPAQMVVDGGENPIKTIHEIVLVPFDDKEIPV